MKNPVRHIPNILTCISLTFGFCATILGINGDYFGAMGAIMLAAVFDFADGFAARMLGAYSAVGKELDSLADMVSFGVAPGMMLFSFLDKLLHDLSWNDSIGCKIFLLSAFAIPVFSAIRLAKFNIDDRQQSSFIGLPVPAHAIFWSSLLTVLAADAHANICIFPPLAKLLASTKPEIMLFVLAVLALATSLLLVSRIPMFSLKTTTLSWKVNKIRYLFLISAILLSVLFGILGVTLAILLYMVMPLGHPPKVEKQANTTNKKTASARNTFIILLLTIPFSVRGEIYAVLVGISEYEKSSNNLTYCHRDAIDMYEMLKRHTTSDKLLLLTNQQAKHNNIVYYSKQLFRRAKPEDVVIFFFSGHGNKNVLFTYDKSLYFSTLQGIFKQSVARRKLIFADACFAGTMRQPGNPGESASGKSGESASGKSSAGSNVLLFLSTRSNQYAQESSSLQNGLFTHYLLAGLKGSADTDGNDCVTAKELFDFVYPKVKERTKGSQIPVMWGKFDADMTILKLNGK